jgi:hypothetical protein
MDQSINYFELDLKANPGAFSTFDAEILVPEVMKIPEGGAYVEIGVDKGKSLSIAKMVAKNEVVIMGVDLRENPQVPGTVFYQGDSAVIANQFLTRPFINVLFIDGDHSYQGCKQDIETWYPFMKKEGVMLFHDCDESSPGVVQAVAEFVNTHTVTRWELFKRVDKNTSMSKIQL